MALYRPASRRPLLIAGGVGLAIGLLAGLAVGQLASPGIAGAISDLRERTASVASALEVLRVEYAEVDSGSADVGGAQQAIERAQAAYADVEADLALIDDSAANDAYDALTEVATLVADRAPTEHVESAVDRVLALLDSILANGGGR